jgi:ATP-dependent Clp protease ATP-binding subunit ClpA
MRLLRKRALPRRRGPRPAERYVAAGAEEARRLGHRYVGTEHVLLALTREPESDVARVLGRFGVAHEHINSVFLARVWAPMLDAEALAALGIDLDAVRERLEETHGRGALDEARLGMRDAPDAGIQCIAPRLKQALEDAVERAGDRPVRDGDVLLGMLNVSHSVAARALAELGVSREAVARIVASEEGPPPAA